MDKNSKAGGSTDSVTPSTALLNQRLDTFSKPRMLAPYEIELLQQSKRAMAERNKQRFASEARAAE